MSEDKPQGATHLQYEKPPDGEIEPEELLEVAARALTMKEADSPWSVDLVGMGATLDRQSGSDERLVARIAPKCVEG